MHCSLYYLAQINIGTLQASISNLYKNKDEMHNNYVNIVTYHIRRHTLYIIISYTRPSEDAEARLHAEETARAGAEA